MTVPPLAMPAATIAICMGVAATSYWPMADSAVCGSSGWVSPPVRACFLFDDPNLHRPTYGYVRYHDLVEEADRHDYHVSFAMIPLDGWFTHHATARLFRERSDRLSLLELGAAFTDLVATARAGRTQPAAMAGGTFTITNVGSFGVDAGTPILNPGESGILCVGAISRRPWVVGTGADERIVPRWVTTLAASFDHRIADGEQGSRFIADVASILEEPALLLD